MTSERDWVEASWLNERGLVCADAGDQDAALSWYRQAAERVPEYEPAWFNMGLVHKRRRQWADAMGCNQRAAALSGAEGATLPGGIWGSRRPRCDAGTSPVMPGSGSG